MKISKRTRKRIICQIMVLSLLVSGVSPFSLAYADNKKVLVSSNDALEKTDKKLSNTSKAIEDIKEEKENTKKDNNLIEKEKNEKIRVIVELKKDPIINEAIDKGKNISDLDKSFVESRKNQLIGDQNKLIKDLDKKNIKVSTDKSINFTTAFNGVSMDVKQKDIKRLEHNPAVKNLYVAQEFSKPDLKSSSAMIGADSVWNISNLKGEGMTVAVIDSGLDYSHNDLRLDESAKSRVKYDKKKINRLIDDKKLPGKYYSEKVPYGYNYYDHSYNLFDSYGVMHGMHVSGIIGANSKENPNLKGIAPNSQLLAMKVFSDDSKYPTTFTDVWLKALDDAIALDADVINMSLGSPSGLSHEGKKHPEVEMLRKARETGIIVSIAAGNEANIVKGNSYKVKALKENYDTAEVANPAVNEDSFAVAASENMTKRMRLIEWGDYSKFEPTKEPINLHRGYNSPDIISGKIVDLREGTEEDFNNNNGKLKGAIVLLEINDDTKSYKLASNIEKITANNPAATILYNGPKDKSDNIGASMIIGGNAGKYTIGRIKRETYDKIMQDKTKPGFYLKINAKEQTVANENAGLMSTFSSWGPSPDLRIKPEITAPGGNIYSTIEDNKYESKSGTSMAAPHVAGASALVKQYLKSTYKDMVKKDLADNTKLILMNTAKPIENKSKVPYFVRQQGAGLIQVDKAINNKVLMRVTGTNDNIKDGKLEAKEIRDGNIIANIELENLGKLKKTYKITNKTLKEKIDKGRRTEEPELLKTRINTPMTISVEPGKKVTLSYPISVNSKDINNDYIEGFIRLEDTDKNEENRIDLNAPFLAFVGDWSKQNAIDAFEISEKGHEKRNVQFTVNKEANAFSSMFTTDKLLRLPVIDNCIYISPKSTYHSTMALRLAPLRCMEEVEYSILNKDGKKLRTLGVSNEVRKLNRLGINNSFQIMPDSLWDQKIGGKSVEEGKEYIYQIKARLNTGKEQEQVYQYPVRVDNGEPVIENYKLENDDETNKANNISENNYKTISFDVQDKGTGIMNIYLESMKFIKDKIGNNPNVDNTEPGSKPTIPGFDNTQPGKMPKDSLNPDKNKDKTKDDFGKYPIISGPKGVAKFGKYIKISFVDSTRGIKPESVLELTEENKLEIRPDMLKNNKTQSMEFYVVKPKDRDAKIHVKASFYADTGRVRLTVKDHLSNKTIKESDTGVKTEYSTINIPNYYNHIQKTKAQIIVNGKPMTSHAYSSTESSARIEIKLPAGKNLQYLSVVEKKQPIYLIRDSKRTSNVSDRVKMTIDKKNNTVILDIAKFDRTFTIIPMIGDGELPDEVEEKPAKIIFSPSTDMKKYKSIKYREKVLRGAGKEFNPKQDKVLNTKTGHIYLEMIFADGMDMKDKKIKGISIKENGETINLEKVPSYFDIEAGKLGYTSSSYSLNIGYQLKGDAEISIEYVDSKDEESKKPSIKIIDESKEDHHDRKEDQAPSDRVIGSKAYISKPSQEEIEDWEKESTNTSKDKYPSLYIYTPELLDILTEKKAPGAKMKVEGFIGNIKPSDKIDHVSFDLVDSDGKAIGEPIVIKGDQLKEELTKYGNGKTIYYIGMGYHFEIDVPVSVFNVNLRAEVRTVNNESATVTRRAFYDNLKPVLNYEVMDRDLDSDKVKIKVTTKDESLKLNLYRDTSLEAYANLVNETFISTKGVKIEKILEIPLEVGQNTIRLRSVDMANNEIEKDIHIYRTGIQ